MINKQRDSLAAHRHEEICRVDLLLGNGSDAHFHTQHVTLQIPRSVNCKRLSTRKSVNSQHNTKSFKPIGALC